MNYKEYKAIMEEKGLIESFKSMHFLVNAEQCQRNIKNIIAWDDFTLKVMTDNGIGIDNLLHYWNNMKTVQVKMAIAYAVPKEEQLAKWNELEYMNELQQFKSELVPTVAPVTEKLEPKKEKGNK